MKKTLIALMALTPLASAETYTWAPQGNSQLWGSANNWQTSNGSPATAIPQYDNTNEDTYIINDGYTVSAHEHSVGNLGATLLVGDNVTLGGNWAFIFKNITIGKNFTSTFEGDGIKWATNASSFSNTANTLNIDSLYSHNNLILSTIGANSTVNFGTEGCIALTSNATQGVGVTGLNGKALTLTAAFTMGDATGSGELQLVTRYLISGTNIWYRDVEGDNKVVDYDSSILTETSGYTLSKYDLAKSDTAEWQINGQKVSNADLVAGAYRFFATEEGGIGIQYWNALAIPEPTTATLSLLALCGLAARRRRK